MRSILIRGVCVCLVVFGFIVHRGDTARASANGLVISQVYGGGGNSGATYKNDFIELFNAGSAAVSLTGFSVQYASAAGTTWAVTALSGSIAPGQYYLIQEAAGTGGTASLPTPNATGAINMSATAGKVALAASITPLTGSCPTSVIDFVGFGPTANCAEGNAPTLVLTNTTAALRKGDGAQDTDNNAADFVVAAPNPRSGAAATAGNPTATMTAAPSTLSLGSSTTFSATVTPGTNPASTGINVTVDVSPIGGPPSLPLVDQGGNVFSAPFTLPATVTTGGTFTIKATVTDAQTRTGTAQTAVTIVAPTPPSAHGSANPATVASGGSVTFTVGATPGTSPASTGMGVTADLTAIGAGTPTFQTTDGLTFTFTATVAAGTASGVKTLPLTVSDSIGRASNFTIALDVESPFVAPSVKISQVYGGGGNSGATYANDYIELFNQGSTAVDLKNYSVQYQSAAQAGAWQVSSICPGGTCVIAPGHYFLVQESAGANSVAPLPVADASGTIPMGASAAKVALVGNSTALTGGCPAGGAIVDMVGYGSSATCFEGSPAPGLSNTTAAVRRGNGCIDTSSNAADFVAISPIPRNSSTIAHVCADASRTSAVSVASPDGPEKGDVTTLSVQVTPPAGLSTHGVIVTADLTPIGGSAAQPFFDDATNGDVTANDGTFTFTTRIPFDAAYGMRNITVTIGDGLGNVFTDPLFLSVTAPTCGTERWAVKVGDDVDAGTVNLSLLTPTTIGALRSQPSPNLDITQSNLFRVGPVEQTAWVVNATMTLFKLETDVDYHIVLSDDTDTVISEIPLPDCATDRSPFKPFIRAARANFDAHLSATPDFQPVTLPVQVTGVGFFDYIHGQTGVAPNGIELHPVLSITFLAPTTTTVSSSTNPSAYQQNVDLTATVASAGAAASGQVSFFDGGAALGTVDVDAQGHATFHAGSLTVGTHAISASYGGDAATAASRSDVFSEVVNKADQTITFAPIANRSFSDGDFDVTAGSTSNLGVTLSIASGPATIANSTIHPTGAGTVVVRASQAGDGNFNPALSVDHAFDVSKAAQTITFPGTAPAPRYGALPFIVTAVGGASGSPVTFAAQGACTVQGGMGVATLTIATAGPCTLTASQAGSDNYAAAADASEVITIGLAAADLSVKDQTAVYNGQPHGLTGKAIGVNGEDLGALFTFGPGVTNAPGGDVWWSFSGNQNYQAANGVAHVAVTPATAVFIVSSPTIEAGQPSVTLGGRLALGSVIPTGTVAITLGATTLSAVINPDGSFAAALPSSALTVAGSPYAATYTYPGDGNFTVAAAAGQVTVVDTTPPSISGIAASPGTLGPPNHKMIDVLVGYSATDIGGAPVCGLSVSSNEPVNGAGDGNTAVDWSVIDAHHVSLRAERAGPGNGRVYTITIGCADAAGNRSNAIATVRVPK